jgi:Lrp/AsnC family leucine-responsive transcriptional regulator
MNLKLDLKDKKILYELDINSRESFSVIAKKVGLSKNSVIERVKKLRELGIIRSYHVWIDEAKLGFMHFRIYLNLKNASPQKENEIIEFLARKKIVTWVGSMDGAFNLGALVITKNINELHELWDELFSRYVNFIQDRLLAIVAKKDYYSKAYLIQKKSDKKIPLLTLSNKEDISTLDFKILKMLSSDARIPVISIAEKTNSTPKTIISHIKELEKRKIIIGYTANLDLDKLGFQRFRVSFILFRLTPEKIASFHNYALTHPNIIIDEEIVGGDDYEVEINVKDISELRKIIEDIKSKFSDIIQDYHILHIFREDKNISILKNSLE